tara:strand:- start:7654 stop:8304 length:651 start_codon:yes stop_codon:yes gene_type:complete
MAKIHNGFINNKLKNTFKDGGLNNFDLATTKVYKGVKPMWEQLGFQNDDSDIPTDNSYWKKIIPSDFTFFNYSNVMVQEVESDSQIGVSTGAKTPRDSYQEITISEQQEQTWSQNYTYPILPRLNEFGIFEHQVNVSSSYGSEDGLITNLQDEDGDLIFHLDLGNSTTDDIIDKTEINKINYNQDIELSLDKNLRLEVLTTNTPDTIEIDNTEQAF